jgi:hypothetical protein
MLYTQSDMNRAMRKAFWTAFFYAIFLCSLLAAFFVLRFALVDVSADIVGNLYVTNPQIAGVLHEIRRVVSILTELRK